MTPADENPWTAVPFADRTKTREVLFDISRDLLGSASPDGYFTALNPAWELALGFSIAVLMERPFIEFVHPNDRTATRAELAKLFLEGKESVDFENRYAMAGGGWRYLSWQTKLHDDLVYFDAHDITGQIVPKDRSRKTSEFVERIDDAIFTGTPEGVIKSWNRNCEELYGFSAAEAVGRNVRDLTIPEGRMEEPDVNVNQLLEGGGVTQTTTRRRTRSGDLIDVTQTASLRRDAAGQIMDIVVVSQEVSGLDPDDPEVKEESAIVAWAALIRDAINQERVMFHAQPIVDLQGGPVSYELLCRIIGLDGRIARPREFMAAAERHGLLEDIDLLGVRTAARYIAEGHSMTVNVSIGTIRRKNVVDTFMEELRSAGAEPSRLTIDISETALMQNQDYGIRFVNDLAANGIGVTLDDFGSGLGGFTNLRQLPIQNLKIDVEFIRNLHESAASQHVVQAVVNLTAAFGMTSVAEGVEDPVSESLLRKAGVLHAQGNLYSEPGPIEEIVGKSFPMDTDPT
ncbi:MAG: sensor domain-containing phosphodiesterase [Solirubrobacterales bacterium]